MGSEPDNQSGGAVRNESAQFQLVNCLLSGNSAKQHDGAIYTAGSSASLEAVNCVLAGNQAENHGGGIAVDSGSLHLLNCTVAGNAAHPDMGYGGGLYLASGSTLTLENSILWGNNSSSAPQVEVVASAVFSGANNLIESWSTDDTRVISNADPLFVDSVDAAQAPYGLECTFTGTFTSRRRRQ